MFNAAAYLEETIRSVLAQTFSDWELLLVDDGSVDRTAVIARAFLADPRVKYFHQENGGVSAARNAGLLAAQGEFIAFLDADDVWLPDNLRLKVGYLEANRGTSWVHADVELIGERSQATGEIQSGRQGWVLDDLLLWERHIVPAPSGFVFRRTAVSDLGGFDPALSTGADQDLYFRLAARSPVGRICGVLTRYRVHHAAMHLDIARMERDHMAVYRKARSRDLFRSRWFRRRCFANLYLILAGSWWREGRSRVRASVLMLRAALTYPPIVGTVLRRVGPARAVSLWAG